MKRFYWCVGIGTSFFLRVVVAQADVDKLLRQENRPTIQDLLRELAPFPDKNPFPPMIHDPFAGYIAGAGAQLIAELEYMYPGAAWAPLGRDSSLAADILESYYLWKGQADRVVRLNASGQSFVNHEDYINLLKSVRLVDESGKPVKKFVILDPTSWGSSSQSRMVTASVYQSYPDSNKVGLIPFVNAIDLGNSSKNYITNINPIQFWQQSGISYGSPSNVSTVTYGFKYLPVWDKSEIVWHDRFLTMQKGKNGFAYAPPGPAKGLSERNHVLWWMYEVVKTVQSDEFGKRVESIAKKQFKYSLSEYISQYGESFHDAVFRWVKSNLDTHDAQDKSSVFSQVCVLFEKEIRKHFKVSSKSELSREKVSELIFAQAHLPFSILPHIDDLFAAWVGDPSKLDSAETMAIHFGTWINVGKNETSLEPEGQKYVQNVVQRFSSLVNMEGVFASFKSPDQYLVFFQTKEVPYKERKRLIRSIIEKFFELNPSIEQINGLSALAKKNGKLHQEIVRRALFQVHSADELRRLEKPRTLFGLSSYGRAESKFKKAHPEFFQNK